MMVMGLPEGPVKGTLTRLGRQLILIDADRLVSS